MTGLRKENLTQKRLKELLEYDKDSGNFTWKETRGGKRKGSVAGTIDCYGYIRISIDDKRYKAHRLAWLYVYGYVPENEIDHKDTDRKNNKWKNLRHASHQCNMRNCKVQKNSKSGVTGVYWDSKRKKWKSRIGVNGEEIYLGSHSCILDAAKSRWEAECKYNYSNCLTTSSSFIYIQENDTKVQIPR